MYQSSTPVKPLLMMLLLALVSKASYAQTYHFTSQEDEFGFWTNAATWTNAYAWPPDHPSTTGGSNSNSDIKGYVRREGNLTLGNGSITTIRDGAILWITGDLTMTGGADIFIESGGLLVVEGDMDLSNGVGGEIDGVAVIKGNLRIVGNDIVANFQDSKNSGDFYIYEDTYYDGVDVSAYGVDVPDEVDFENEHPDLYAFVEGGGPLPITLLSFEGYVSNEGIVLNWTTGTEENFDFFTVERAGADLSFKAVGSVTGHGFSDQTLDYSFVDSNPLPEVAYYRLKATDYDGFEEYHKVIAVMVQETAERSAIFPNPVLNKQVNVYTANANNQLQLINYSGTKVFQTPLSVSRNSYTLPPSLPAGYYMAVITDSEGQHEQHRVLIR